MPDKEFDKLFKNKFADAEIIPSANLWAKIEDQLEPKRKRMFPVLWMAAASVVILVSATLLFQKTDKIQLRAEQQVVNNAKVIRKEVLPIKEIATNPIVKTQTKTQYSFVAKNEAIEQIANKVENNQIAMQPIKEVDRLPIKQQEVLPFAIVPIKENVVENPIVIAQVVPKQDFQDQSISETDAYTERKGIRNMGDIINFVVDKVDKRDKKLVKFTTDDDDNSSLVGINIGFLKINKKNK